MRKEYVRIAEKNNFGFHRVERLPGNVGYLELRVFYDHDIASETAVAAMNFLSQTDALIIDLRKNIGGSPYTAALIASYFVNEPTHFESFYRRDEDSVSQVWTLPYVPGKLYGNKQVIILTSKKTFSAGELFAYAFKHMGRAEVIGEATGGGANAGNYHQVTKHIRLFIPSGRPISPFTNSNWEGTGVEPSMKVSEEEAFSIAYKKALQGIKEIYSSQPGYEFLIQEIDESLKR
jgi:C-terminal processing protease CtpA/Prc